MDIVEMSTEKNILSKTLLDTIVDNLIEERILSSIKSTKNDNINEELISYSNVIMDKMGSSQNLFMRYEELSTLNENNSLKNAYKRGLKDGIQLLGDIILEGRTRCRIP